MLSNINEVHRSIDDIRENRTARRHSCCEYSSAEFCEKVDSINNTTSRLKRSLACEDLTLINSHGIDIVRIEFNPTLIKDINAKNYTFCGSAISPPINNLAISTDNDGNLILIKGASYDFFRGLAKKCTTGYRYQTAKLITKKYQNKFKDIYIDDKGSIVVSDACSGKNYILKLSLVDNDTSSSEQFIKLSLRGSRQKCQRRHLIFKINQQRYSLYSKKNHKLYFRIIEGDYNTIFNVTPEIKIPLHSGYRLSHIKKTMGVLQIEIEKNSKRRVFYINPQMSVNKISHKPPQLLANRLGNDPHEKYHAGLPFTSDRKSNFSSKAIPLVSSVVDRFRVNIKKAKLASGGEVLVHLCNAIDPGISSLYTAMKQQLNSRDKIFSNAPTNRKQLYDYNMNKVMHHSLFLAKVAHEALGIESEHNFSQTLTLLAHRLRPGEIIHLSSTNKIAAFFGLGMGGLPFAPGWFLGAVLEFSKNHSISIAKASSEKITLTFNNQRKLAATAIAGSGQGLEKAFVTARAIDYMTVMPFEANAIMAAQLISANDFCFTLSEPHFKEFVQQFSHSEKDSWLKHIITDQARATKAIEKNFVIKIEARNELRLQAGNMVNPYTYMVFPRTALGSLLVIELLNIKQHKSQHLDNINQHSSSDKKQFIITSLNSEINFIAEWKVMPIAMNSGDNQQLWCYPLPLLEEGRSLASFRTEQSPIGFGEIRESSLSPELAGSISISHNICDAMAIPVVITVNENQKISKGITLQKMAKIDSQINKIKEILIPVKKSLSRQQRSSQHKFCSVELISHYETIPLTYIPLSKKSVPVLNSSSPTKTAYRLTRLEFRRRSSLQHQDTTLPIPIFNCATTYAITHEQYLGEIILRYNPAEALLPAEIQCRLLFIY